MTLAAANLLSLYPGIPAVRCRRVATWCQALALATRTYATKDSRIPTIDATPYTRALLTRSRIIIHAHTSISRSNLRCVRNTLLS